MKTKLISLMLLLMMTASVNAQKHEFGNWKRYAQANRELGAPPSKLAPTVLPSFW